MTGNTDAVLSALMVSAQEGDQAAYRALLRGCTPIAAGTARRVGVPADRIDDVVQETLLTVHRARATYDRARPFLPWLRAIAQRRAVDCLRTHGRSVGREADNEAAYLNYPAAAPEADALVDRADQSAVLAAAIATLPPGQRQAVELLVLKENALDQASSLTGRSKTALKVNLHRAIQALRGKLRNADDV